MSRSSQISESDGRPGSRSRDMSRDRTETPNTAIFTKVVYLFRIGPYKLVDLCKWSAFVNNRTMRDNCSAAPRLQHCVEITSVSFTVSAVLSRSRLGLEGNCLGLVLVSADSENKCLCLVSVSNTNCLVSAEAVSDPTLIEYNIHVHVCTGTCTCTRIVAITRGRLSKWRQVVYNSPHVY